jgi:hypothetical protein
LQKIDEYSSKSNIAFNSEKTHFNKLKLNILNKKLVFPIKIMIYLCLLNMIIILVLVIYYEKKREKLFNILSNFLDVNIFFNMTKMGVGIMYLTTLNIRWQLHNCTFSDINNMTPTSLYSLMISENIDFLWWIKNFTNFVNSEFDEILFKKNVFFFDKFGMDEKERYEFNNDVIINYFISEGIKLLKIYPGILNTKNNVEFITFGIVELDNLIEQTYTYFTSHEINGYQDEELNNRIGKILDIFPFPFLVTGLILVLSLMIYAFYLLKLYKIEIYFIEKLMNFSSPNFENYRKELDEIKKKMKKVNFEEEKDDMEINEYSDTKLNTKREDEKSSISKKKINRQNKKTKKNLNKVLKKKK